MTRSGSSPSHRSRPAAGRSTGFAWVLIGIGAVALGFGLHGLRLGLATLNWPKVEAEIVDARLTVRDTTSSRGPSGLGPLTSYGRDEFAAWATSFRYEIGGAVHIGHGVERGDLGLQNSAKSRELDLAHPIGSRATVVVDPSNPDEAYLVAGTSSAAKMATGVGAALVVIGLWLRRLMLRGAGRSRPVGPSCDDEAA